MLLGEIIKNKINIFVFEKYKNSFNVPAVVRQWHVGRHKSRKTVLASAILFNIREIKMIMIIDCVKSYSTLDRITREYLYFMLS